MRAYTIHEPPHPPADRMDRAEALVFVRDGMSWLALLAPPLWMLVRGLWLALGLYVVAVIALTIALAVLDIPLAWSGVVSLVPNILIALEADSIERWSLARRGWRMVGTVSGGGDTDCERRFFEAWLPAQPMIAGAAASAGHGTLAGPGPATSPVAPPPTGRPDKARAGWWPFGRRS